MSNIFRFRKLFFPILVRNEGNNMTTFSIQPILENDRVLLQPLQQDDFEALYEVASDPAIWEQHPNKDRWQKDVFRTYFEGALASGGAFIITDKQTGAIAGSTRYYQYNAEDNSIMVGYTFYATRFWGTGINTVVKHLMLNYIFRYVSKVILHVGALNKRSQIAVERIGAVKTGEETVTYYGEAPRLNFVYEIQKP